MSMPAQPINECSHLAPQLPAAAAADSEGQTCTAPPSDSAQNSSSTSNNAYSAYHLSTNYNTSKK
jgi:hypothetical protein